MEKVVTGCLIGIFVCASVYYWKQPDISSQLSAIFGEKNAPVSSHINPRTEPRTPEISIRWSRQPEEPVDTTPPRGSGGEDATARALKLEAEIAARTQAYSQRPRRRAISAYRFAQYIEDWRDKTERVAALTYPAGERDSLYDSLILTVSIKKDGTIEKIKIARPSKYRALNDAAVKIIRNAAPYAPFPAEIAHDTDVIDITRTWTFANGTLVTR
jgi:protein TonB